MMQHMSKILEEHGHEVIVAVDGETGFNKIENEEPDLVFAEITIPRKDGFEIIAETRKKHPGIKFIAMTSDRIVHGDQYLRAVKSFGVEMTLKKPFRDRYLIEAVESVLGTRKGFPPDMKTPHFLR